jgi:transcriptional regulator with GAF, ATPase, and Fis domain
MDPWLEPESASLRGLLLEMPEVRCLDDLLRRVVDRLAERSGVRLARIWLMRPGDICDDCAMREQCPDRTRCLHLVASAGRSRVDPELEWNGVDGRFRRFPLGVRKIGHIGTTGETVFVADMGGDSRWIANPAWARRENIRGMAGQPIVHRGEILGVLAAFGEIVGEDAVAWLRLVADHLGIAISNAAAFEEIDRLKRRLEQEIAYLREEFREARCFGEIVGQSSAVRTIGRQVELVAPTAANVLILGESGTGKELVAREIHKRSERSRQPLIKVNCASIPRELYESEFFGHVRGAFTGVTRDRTGRFELADRGTLFLDEVGEIPLELQSKLLRVLQEGQYERVGDERTRRTDVRVIAATNRDLKAEVDAGRFRRDLYYRLNVVPLEVPPLRQRVEDVPLLATHFLRLAAKGLNRETPRLTHDQVSRLQRYAWPGNVRELQNAVERAVILSVKGALRFDLPDTPELEGAAPPVSVGAGAGDGTAVLTEREMRLRERDNILAALRQAGWKTYGPQGAAALLGVRPTTLASRIKKLGLKRPS